MKPKRTASPSRRARAPREGPPPAPPARTARPPLRPAGSARVGTLFLVLAAGALAAAPALSCEDLHVLQARRAALAEQTASLSKADLAREHFTLGVWARDHALPEEAQKEFRAALAADPDHEAAHAALGDVKLADRWIAHDDAMAAKGLVRRDGRWILREEAEILDLPAKDKATRREQQAKVEKLLRSYAVGGEAQRKFAEAALGTVDDRWKVEPFAYALRAKSDDVRVLAAKELGRIGNRRALQPLVRRVLVDPSQDVRFAALDAAKEIGDANLLAPLVRGLQSETPEVSRNAAEAIGRLGDVRGVRWLVWRLEAHGATGQRVHFSQVNQLTYIQDFDVEVAQTAFIADPIVGVLQEGVVLDVQLHSVDRVTTWVERTVMHGALQRLTGATDVKDEPGAWAAWWKEHAKDYDEESVAAK